VPVQFALTNQPTTTLILVSLLYVRRIQTLRNLTLRSTCMSAGATPKRLRQPILKLSRSTPTYRPNVEVYAFFNDLIINKKSIFSYKFVAYASSLHVAGVWPVVAYILRHQAITASRLDGHKTGTQRLEYEVLKTPQNAPNNAISR